MSQTERRVLEVATIIDILSFAGLTPPKGRNNIRCPLPDHADGTPSFSVLPSNKGWKCHGCGRRGGVLQLAVLLGLAGSNTAAVSYLARNYNIPEEPLGQGTESRPQPRRGNFAKPVPRVVPFAKQAEEVDDATLERVAARRSECRSILGTLGAEYLRHRGFEPDAADACGVLFHPNWERRGPAIVFQIFDKKARLVGLQGRFCGLSKPPVEPKVMGWGNVGAGVFSTPGALRTGKDGLDGPVAITEGPLDAIALAVNGMPAIAICGAANVPAFEAKNGWLLSILAGKPVALALDNDEAGQKAREKIAELLRRFGCYLTEIEFDGKTIGPGGYKDAAEMLQENAAHAAAIVRAAIIEARQPYWDLHDLGDAA